MLKGIGAKLMSLVDMNKPRKLEGLAQKIFMVIAIAFSIIYLYTAGPSFLGRIPVQWVRGSFMLLMAVMIFMKFPASNKAPKNTVSWVDLTMIVLSIITFGYWILQFKSIISRPGMMTDMEMVLASLAVIISLEISRRVLGLIFPLVAVLIITYSMLGDSVLLPEIMRSPGFTWAYIVTYCYTLDGIFGFILNTIANFVVLFVIFGGLMSSLGAGDFFINFPYALTCGLRGGPAKTAVLASALMGSISGSATANTAATGAFTIPLMIKTGYPKEVAGAVEPSASTGGMFMPPVMGAGAFIMAELLGVPYTVIVKAAIAPAIIYFFSVYMIVHFYAGAKNIPPIPKEERPDAWAIFKDGFYYFIPLILLIYLLMTYMSAGRAVYWTILSMLVITLIVRLIRKDQPTVGGTCKKFAGDVLKGLKEGAQDSLTIGAVTGSTGIVVAGVMITGLGFTFTTAVMALAGKYIIMGILMSLIAAYVLGMGLTVTAAYILCAILAAPALVKLGILPIAAHFLLFWYSQTSNISPPVCLAAFVGAGIAKAHPFKVGFNSLIFSAFIFIMPLLFVYSEILMPNGLNFHAFSAMISGFLATIPYAAAITGFYRAKLNWPLRAVLLLASVCMVFPEKFTDYVGLTIMIVIYVWQCIREKYKLNLASQQG